MHSRIRLIKQKLFAMPYFIPRFCLILLLAGGLASAGLSLAPQRAAAQAVSPPAQTMKPAGPAPATGGAALSGYDEKLMRLAEVLGSLHYLANLCPPAPQDKTEPKAAKTKSPAAPPPAPAPPADGGYMIWRDYMQQLLAALRSDGRQNARLYAAFNRSYQSLAGNYGRCTPAAREALARYRLEGQNISAVLLENYGSDY